MLCVPGRPYPYPGVPPNRCPPLLVLTPTPERTTPHTETYMAPQPSSAVRGVWWYHVCMTYDAQVSKLTPTERAALGELDGMIEYKYIFGVNPDIDIAAAESVTREGGRYAGFPLGNTTAETLTFVSTAAADALFGAGIWSLTVEGLGDDWEEVSASVAVSGVTPVETTGVVFRRVNRVYASALGLGDGASGAISATNTTTTANVFTGIVVGQDSGSAAVFTTPASKRALIKSIHVSLSNGASGVFRLRTTNADTNAPLWSTRATFAATDNADIVFEGGVVVNGKTDIELLVDSVDTDNTVVSVSIEMLLLPVGTEA
jgi:hypothetical protein